MCKSDGTSFYKDIFYECNTCEGLFRPKSKLPSYQEEKERYLKHQNDPEDEGYQDFVKPLTDLLIANQTAEHIGLDFGAGSGSAVHKQLSDNGFVVKQYDPIYYNNPDLLNNKYDYIYACEVIEHFHHPFEEFSRLFNMLNPGGRLYCKTSIYTNDVDFDNWYYKNDFTHVFIYKNRTFQWIASNFNPSEMTINDNIIQFKK